MRIGMVHQPHFLPWSGYLSRCLAADVFIALDNVKFNRNQYQHRSKYVDAAGRLRWLTLPIVRSSRSSQIRYVRISDGLDVPAWGRPVVEAYRKASHFQPVWSEISATIERGKPDFLRIADSTLSLTLGNLAAAAGLQPVVMAKSSDINNISDRTLRLVDICKHLEVTHLIMGESALKSHDTYELIGKGIRLVRHRYCGPSDRAPVAGLMGLHSIMHSGFEYVASTLTNHWRFEEIRL